MPYTIEGEDRRGAWIVSCDHASNAVPGGLDLGLPAEEMARHIAFDVGAAGVARALAERLGGPAILGAFSRLVVDPNRGEDDPTLVMRLYDGTVVPGNARVDAAETERRLTLYHRPYHAALGALMARPGARLVAVHSFTPRLNGRSPRPWPVGILSADDRRLAQPLIASLRSEGLCVGDNEPYSGALPGDAVDRHALAHGRPNALIELRNDLIGTPLARAEWAERLARHLEAARIAADL